MAFSINKVILVGNVGREPEIRSLQDGGKVASFTLATSESWKDRTTGERKETTTWHRIVVFNQVLADVCEKYVHKGGRVYIEGQLQNREWVDQTGAKRFSTEVVISRFRGDIVLMSGEKSDSTVSLDNISMEHSSSDYNDDDIPF